MLNDILTTKHMILVTDKATVEYPCILDSGVPRIKNLRFIWKDKYDEKKLYTDTGYELCRVYYSDIGGIYRCYAREASL